MADSVTRPPNYQLLPYMVPEPPRTPDIVDRLRWVIAVMDGDDKDLGFAGSLLSYAFKNGDVTDRQAKYANRMIERVKNLHASNLLRCQTEDPAAALPARTSSSEASLQ